MPPDRASSSPVPLPRLLMVELIGPPVVSPHQLLESLGVDDDEAQLVLTKVSGRGRKVHELQDLVAAGHGEIGLARFLSSGSKVSSIGKSAWIFNAVGTVQYAAINRLPNG